MLDLTDARYLGLRHPWARLRPWSALTTGGPALLSVPPVGAAPAAELARRAGGRAALLSPSTLHALVDVLTVLAGAQAQVVLDKHAYWVAATAARVTGSPRATGHLDVRALRADLAAVRRLGKRPVAVVDGWCPGCGRPAPLRDYAAAVEQAGGLLVVDDTQAAGVLGADPRPSSPLGAGGGGSAAWAGVRSSCLVVVSSLAKAWSVPVTVTVGPAELLLAVERDGPSRLHASPPSAAHIAALEHALTEDRRTGAQRRRRLAALVALFRTLLRAAGLHVRGGPMPQQCVPLADAARARVVQHRLTAAGLRVLPQQPACRPGAAVAVLLNAALAPADVRWAAGEISRVCREEWTGAA